MFVIPSLQDNLSHAGLESHTCTSPVIALSTGGLVDIVDERITGSLANSCTLPSRRSQFAGFWTIWISICKLDLMLGDEGNDCDPLCSFCNVCRTLSTSLLTLDVSLMPHPTASYPWFADHKLSRDSRPILLLSWSAWSDRVATMTLHLRSH